jgi:hypothetical protein
MDEMQIPEGEEFATSGHVIYVANMRAMVARFGANQKLRLARNWEGLEQDALRAIQDQGGGLNITGLYRCPRALAERALWG